MIVYFRTEWKDGKWRVWVRTRWGEWEITRWIPLLKRVWPRVDALQSEYSMDEEWMNTPMGPQKLSRRHPRSASHDIKEGSETAKGWERYM